MIIPRELFRRRPSPRPRPPAPELPGPPLLPAAIVGQFGTAGLAIHGSAAGGSAGYFGEAITLDLQGRILVAWWSHDGNDYDIVVWRYE